MRLFYYRRDLEKKVTERFEFTADVCDSYLARNNKTIHDFTFEDAYKLVNKWNDAGNDRFKFWF